MADEKKSGQSNIAGTYIPGGFMAKYAGNGGSSGSSNAQPAAIGQNVVNPITFTDGDWSRIAANINQEYKEPAERDAMRIQLANLYAGQTAKNDNERQQLAQQYYDQMAGGGNGEANTQDNIQLDQITQGHSNPFYRAVGNLREGLLNSYEAGGGVLDAGIDAAGGMIGDLTGNEQLGKKIQDATNAQNLAPVVGMATDLVSSVPLVGPVIGGVKGAIESSDDFYRAAEGIDPVTGQALNNRQRLISGGAGLANTALSALPGIAVTKSAGKRALAELPEQLGEIALKRGALEDVAREAKAVKESKLDDFITARDAVTDLKNSKRELEDNANDAFRRQLEAERDYNRRYLGTEGEDVGENTLVQVIDGLNNAYYIPKGKKPLVLDNFAKFNPDKVPDKAWSAVLRQQGVPKSQLANEIALQKEGAKSLANEILEAQSNLSRLRGNAANANDQLFSLPRRVENARGQRRVKAKEAEDARVKAEAAERGLNEFNSANPEVNKELIDDIVKGGDTNALLTYMQINGPRSVLDLIRTGGKKAAKEAGEETGKKAAKETGEEVAEEATEGAAKSATQEAEDLQAYISEQMAARAARAPKERTRRLSSFLRDASGKIRPSDMKQLRAEGITGPGMLRGYGMGLGAAALNQMSDSGDTNLGNAIQNIYAGAAQEGNLLPLLLATMPGPRRAAARNLGGSTMPYYAMRAGAMNDTVNETNRGGVPLNEGQRAYLEALASGGSIEDARNAVLALNETEEE